MKTQSINNMFMMENKNKLRNQLRITRKRLGLHQKQIAHLLNHKTTDQVGRYEKGYRIPGLKILLQLEIVYGLPARALYRDYFEELQAEIKGRVQTLKLLDERVASIGKRNNLAPNFCSYEELLRNPNLSQMERDHVRKHIIVLMGKHEKIRPNELT